MQPYFEFECQHYTFTSIYFYIFLFSKNIPSQHDSKWRFAVGPMVARLGNWSLDRVYRLANNQWPHFIVICDLLPFFNICDFCDLEFNDLVKKSKH